MTRDDAEDYTVALGDTPQGKTGGLFVRKARGEISTKPAWRQMFGEPHEIRLRMMEEKRARREHGRTQNPSIPVVAPTVTVYLIGSAGGGLVKIGQTSDVRRRLGEIQRMSPVLVEVLWQSTGDAALEKKLHRAFARLRVHGEWFDFGDSDPVSVVNQAAAR